MRKVDTAQLMETVQALKKETACLEEIVHAMESAQGGLMGISPAMKKIARSLKAQRSELETESLKVQVLSRQLEDIAYEYDQCERNLSLSYNWDQTGAPISAVFTPQEVRRVTSGCPSPYTLENLYRKLLDFFLEYE